MSTSSSDRPEPAATDDDLQLIDIDVEGSGPSPANEPAEILFEAVPPPVGDRLVVGFGDPPETPESLRVSAILWSYRGAALVVALIAVSVFFGRTYLGLSMHVAAGLSIAVGILAPSLFVAGHAHALVLRSRRPGPSEGRHTAALMKNPTDLSAQFLANEMQIYGYQQLAMRQARHSFRHGQWAMSIALAILIVGASIVMTVPMGTTQLVVGGLTALGSTFSGFLARTFLDARNRSIEQLNRSHLVPQAKTLLFVAQRLSAEVGDDRARFALLGEVVKSALRSVDTILAGEADNGRGRLDRAKRRAPRASDRAAGGDPE